MTPKQRNETLTTGSFPVAQFDSNQKPFVTFGNVPIADRCRCDKLTFHGIEPFGGGMGSEVKFSVNRSASQQVSKSASQQTIEEYELDASAFRLGRLTGNTVSWHTRDPKLSNACCLYCGQLVSGPDAVPSDKEHLIARNFVPLGSMDGHPFNFIFRACRACNARKATAERHVSSVTLFNSPGRATDSRANAAAERKGNSDFHPRKKGVRVQDAGEELKIETQRGDMSMSFGMTAPPQLDRRDAGEVCFSHIQGLFSLITTTEFRNLEQIRLLPQDQFIWYDMYPHQDWGNPQAVELAHRVRYWECLANIESADGYFKATMRCSEAGWFWALEWNKQLRLVGGIGQGPMQIFKHLPSEEWMPTPRGRMRREVPLDPATDILFAGVVQLT